MPLTEELGKAYTSYYTHSSESVQAASYLSRIKAAYNGALSLLDFLTGIRSEAKRLNTMHLPLHKPARLLEVGCGSGHLLHLLTSYGWDARGIEVDAKAVEFANSKYGLNVRSGDLPSANYPGAFFDFIVMNHVIEHLPDPVITLKECNRILKPGGMLVVTTPNTISFGHRIFKSNWIGLDPPRHLYLFSPLSLDNLAVLTGFQTTGTRSSAGRATFFFAGSSDISLRGRYNMTSGTPRPWLSVKSKAMQYLEQMLLKFWPNLGEEAVLIAHKPGP